LSPVPGLRPLHPTHVWRYVEEMILRVLRDLGVAAISATLGAVWQPVVAQGGSRVGATDTAMMAAVLRTAVREGMYTAHGANPPALVCIGLAGSAPLGPGYLEQLADPPITLVNQLQRGRTLDIRPSSACRLQHSEGAPRHTSLVVEPRSGKRGILVWVQDPLRQPDGTYSVELGYFEHGLSAANWKCTVRRQPPGWEVAPCVLLGIA
jgi:hypothetical protein